MHQEQGQGQGQGTNRDRNQPRRGVFFSGKRNQGKGTEAKEPRQRNRGNGTVQASTGASSTVFPRRHCSRQRRSHLAVISLISSPSGTLNKAIQAQAPNRNFALGF